VKDGACDVAGMLKGDVIQTINRKAVRNRDEVVSLLNSLEVGQIAIVSAMRFEKKMIFKLKF
jgi:S1-C subfamily serine protease